MQPSINSRMNDKEEKGDSAKDTTSVDKTNEGSPQISETKGEVPMGLYGWASSWIASFNPFGRSRQNSTVSIEKAEDDKKGMVSFL